MHDHSNMQIKKNIICSINYSKTVVERNKAIKNKKLQLSGYK